MIIFFLKKSSEKFPNEQFCPQFIEIYTKKSLFFYQEWKIKCLVFVFFFFITLGIDSMTFDPQRYAMDYHVIGFQECVSEVARYLIAHEGMDIQNPLRMRLLSHLRCFAAQRELSMKSATPSANQNWTQTTPTYPLTQNNYASTSALAPPPPPPPLPLLTPRSLQTPTTSTITSSILPSSVSSSPATAMYSSSYTSSPHATNYPYVPNLAPTGSSDIFAEPNTPTSTAGAISSNESHSHSHPNSHSQMQSHQQQHYVQHQDQNGSTYTDLSSTQRNAVVSIGYSNQYNPMAGFSFATNDNDPLSAAYNANNKPYRPWGGPEMAY